MNATPARTKKAKEMMTDAENYIRNLIDRLREDGVLDHYPEIAALADEAKAHTDALRRARIDL